MSTTKEKIEKDFCSYCKSPLVESIHDKKVNDYNLEQQSEIRGSEEIITFKAQATCPSCYGKNFVKFSLKNIRITHKTI